MAKCRMVNTRFWDDSYIMGLSPEEKLLFLYLLTNPLTTIAGVYEVEIRRIVFDTGIQESDVRNGLERFEQDGKIIYHAPWLAIVNFVKHQSLNPKVLKGISLALEEAPSEIKERMNRRTKIGAVIIEKNEVFAQRNMKRHGKNRARYNYL